ncbi:hypothetical protein [Photobacterium kishitanii]|uniref:Uncharacterized protein n=1 Tax=Photobacterium kishitanii TaxID=318456 RepID=A0A2T3KM93_9GAMM|nr:hypothetical protein [Photobacterium kishitanii]PSV00920.1 hypothetical protein C9J27_02515 [Photobacterium kishitanii]
MTTSFVDKVGDAMFDDIVSMAQDLKKSNLGFRNTWQKVKELDPVSIKRTLSNAAMGIGGIGLVDIPIVASFAKLMGHSNASIISTSIGASAAVATIGALGYFMAMKFDNEALDSLPRVLKEIVKNANDEDKISQIVNGMESHELAGLTEYTAKHHGSEITASNKPKLK